MTKSDPARGKSKPKKKTAASKRPARTSAKGRSSAPKKAAAEQGSLGLGRLERTRRLLLAALRVWELKRRVRD
jgi:hypothetical protein